MIAPGLKLLFTGATLKTAHTVLVGCSISWFNKENFTMIEPGLKQVYRRAWVPACFITCLPHAQVLLPYHLQGVCAEFAAGWKVLAGRMQVDLCGN